jgi:hypothetical protein
MMPTKKNTNKKKTNQSKALSNKTKIMAKKYTKRPVTIEAMQFTGTEENFNELIEFTGEAVCNFMMSKTFEGQQIATCCVPTMEGLMTATQGDFIIKGIKGEFYPCNEDIFHLTYFEADEITE